MYSFVSFSFLPCTFHSASATEVPVIPFVKELLDALWLIILWRQIAYFLSANFLLVTGADVKCALMCGQEGDAVVAHFEYHKHAVTSIEWSPHEASSLAVSSSDNQLT